MADIYVGGLGCECCACVATEVCSGCFVTGPYRLKLTRVRFDPEGSDCAAIDWSPTDQCVTLCGTGDGGAVTGDGPGGTFTVGGQTFTLTWGAVIRCLSGNRLTLESGIEIDLADCDGTNLTRLAPAVSLFVGDADACDVAGMLGSYNVPFGGTGMGRWTLDFALEAGAC